MILVIRASAVESALREEPLAARSGPRGATLFKQLAPEQTGIVTENKFADPKMWDEHYQELIFGEAGTGIAIGDYDGDGRPDVFVVSKTEPCRLFRNLGNWKFEDVTDQAGLGASAGGWMDAAKSWVGLAGKGAGDAPEFWKQGATFVDVNNDGRLDLYVCRFGAPNLLYINQGDGTFKEEAAARGLAVVDGSGMAAFCDYDRDGWLDVFVHTNMLNVTTHPNGRRSFLFRNNGDGTFTNVTDRAGILGDSSAHSAIWWDYDEDGWPDLYVANDYAPADVLYHNNRDGTFTNVVDRVVPHTPYYAMGADLGDVNNDGRIDLFVADMAATSHEKDFRGMALARERTQADPLDPAVAPQYMRNALYLNTGAGRMLEAALMAGVAATDWTWSPLLEDLDDDGRLDLFVTNGMIREYNNVDLLAKAVEKESIAAQRAVVRASPVLAETNVAFRNLGDLQFENVSAAWGLDERGVSFGSALGDLDGDGDPDLIYANFEHGVTVLRNDSDKGHRVIVALHGTRSNRFGVGTTVRIESASGVQVRQLILARGYLSSSEPVLHFGLGMDSRIDRMTVTWPDGGAQEFGGLAPDRKYTVTEAAKKNMAERTAVAPQFTDVSEEARLAWLSRDETSPESQPLMPFRLATPGPALAAGDLDGDGRIDFVLGGTTKDPLRVIVNGRATNLDTGAGDDGPVLIFDATGRGARDLLVTKAVEAAPRLFVNDGHGDFHAAAGGLLPANSIAAGAAVAADFDRDGRVDVFVGGRMSPGNYPLPARSELLANREGRFVDVTDSIAPGLREVGLVTTALWSDVDGDGWPDLVVATEWGNVRYFHNRAGTQLEDWTEKAGFAAAGNGWWSALASGDFNGDGRPDFVAGNVGLNTLYHADPAHPALLFYGDFAGRGEKQIVEAFYEGDQVYPRASRNELGAKIPSILRRFPRNDIFARATLEQILGKEALAQAQRFTATELRSGVFLSQPDGSYRFSPLPRIAQIAPWRGVAAADFDGDGRVDIYAVQNSWRPVPAIGHFDGGLGQLLHGDGRGNFNPVPAAESGLMVPGEASAVVAADLDGDGLPDLLVARRNATTMAFRNRRKP